MISVQFIQVLLTTISEHFTKPEDIKMAGQAAFAFKI